MSLILGSTCVVGIFGHPVKHSFSPAMHNAAFKEAGLNYCYVPFDVKPDNIQMALSGIRTMGIKGINVTIPHKQAVLPFLDELTGEARLIGAVNTIENCDGRLVGHNTDGAGFVRSFKEQMDTSPSGKRFLVLGAGGAARAVVVQLAVEGAAKIVIANRTEEKAKLLSDHLKNNFSELLTESVSMQSDTLSGLRGEFDVIINTTSVGMKQSDQLVCPESLLVSNLLVADLIYNPSETKLLEAARLQGAICMNGLGMLLYQGAIAFEMWTGTKAPVSIMRQVLKAL